MEKEIDEKEMERRKKLSVSTSNKWKDPEFRKKMIELQKRNGHRNYGVNMRGKLIKK